MNKKDYLTTEVYSLEHIRTLMERARQSLNPKFGSHSLRKAHTMGTYGLEHSGGVHRTVYSTQMLEHVSVNY